MMEMNGNDVFDIIWPVGMLPSHSIAEPSKHGQAMINNDHKFCSMNQPVFEFVSSWEQLAFGPPNWICYS